MGVVGGLLEEYVHEKMWKVSDKLCCGVPIDQLGDILLNVPSVIDQLGVFCMKSCIPNPTNHLLSSS